MCSWRIALLERFWQARHPPRHAAFKPPSSPSSRHSSAHGLPIAAVEGEGHAHALAVVAADLQAVRAPAGVARVHGDAPLVPALLAAGVALEQEPMHLHDAVDPLHVRRGPALPLGLATQLATLRCAERIRAEISAGSVMPSAAACLMAAAWASSMSCARRLGFIGASRLL